MKGGKNLNGFIILPRFIADSWQWYGEPCTRDLFIHCLIKANWKPGDWQGIHYERGEFITSLARLSEELGFSVQNIRTALKHLISTGEITSRSTNKYRVILVNNYDKFQEPNKQSNNEITSNQQATNKQLTTDKQYNNNNQENNKYSVVFEQFWSIYPRKKEKAKAYRRYQARLKDGYSETELLQAATNYATEIKKHGTEERYIKLAATFIGANTPFTDYLERSEVDGRTESTSSFKL